MLMLTLGVTLVKSFYVFAALTIMLISYALIGVVLFHQVSWGQGIDRSVQQWIQPTVHTALWLDSCVVCEGMPIFSLQAMLWC